VAATNSRKKLADSSFSCLSEINPFFKAGISPWALVQASTISRSLLANNLEMPETSGFAMRLSPFTGVDPIFLDTGLGEINFLNNGLRRLKEV